MTQTTNLFITPLYRAALTDHGPIDPRELAQSCDVIPDEDVAPISL